MRGLDAAIEQNAWIDTTRLGVTGGSYGGFMTNWVITQTPRFKAAVAIASLSNLISFYGTSLYTDLVEAEFGQRPWDDYPILWQWSPLAHVEHANTPTLFIHGESDNDVPITQAEEMYTALRKLGVDATLARYPGEGHGFHRPIFIMDSNQRMLETGSISIYEARGNPNGPSGVYAPSIRWISALDRKRAILFSRYRLVIS